MAAVSSPSPASGTAAAMTVSTSTTSFGKIRELTSVSLRNERAREFLEEMEKIDAHKCRSLQERTAKQVKDFAELPYYDRLNWMRSMVFKEIADTYRFGYPSINPTIMEFIEEIYTNDFTPETCVNPSETVRAGILTAMEKRDRHHHHTGVTYGSL